MTWKPIFWSRLRDPDEVVFPELRVGYVKFLKELSFKIPILPSICLQETSHLAG